MSRWNGLALSLCLLVQGCTLGAELSLNPATSAQPQAGIVSWGPHLYVVGGRAASGDFRSEVWRTTVGSDGTLGTWFREADLPRPTASASVVAFGGMLYVAGGQGPDGLRREIWYTLINANGALGFTNSVWTANLRPLPSGRSGAASFLLGGRFFLAGGETSSGPDSSVLSARIWLDGQVGTWFTGSPLPTSAVGYAAAVEQQNVVLSAPNGSSAFRSVPDEHGLPAVWTLESGAQAVFQGSTVVAGRLFTVAAVHGAEAPTVTSKPLDRPEAEAPSLFPSAGVVPAKTQVRAQGLPGDRIVYTVTTDGSVPPAPADSASPPALPKITSSGTYAFRVFRDGWQPSPTVVVRYRTQASSFFVLIQKTLTPPFAQMLSLHETLSNQSKNPVTAVRYQLNVSERLLLGLRATDADADTAYTARVKVSLLEADHRTPVRLSSGQEFSEITFEADTTLEPGTYDIVVESRDGQAGGTFGLELTKGETK